MIKKKICILLLLFFVSNCGPSIKTQRVSLKESDEYSLRITDEWVATDTENAVKDVIEKINNHIGFRTYLAKLGKKPKLFIGEVQNKTSEAYFPIDDLNDEFLNELSNSGKYILLDEVARDRILKEIVYQNDGMVRSEDIKSIGRQSGADLIIFGTVNMKPNTLAGKTTKDYSVNIRMTDIQTGEEVVRVRYKTSKYSKKSGFSW